LSTRDIEDALEEATGDRPLSQTAVSQITEVLWDEYEAFTERDLSGLAVEYLFLDAIYESLRQQGIVSELAGVPARSGQTWPAGPASRVMGGRLTPLFAAAYPKLKKSILHVGYFGRIRLPELLKVNDWVAVVPVAIAIVCSLWWLETAGL